MPMSREKKRAYRRMPQQRAYDRARQARPDVKRRVLNSRLLREYSISLEDRDNMVVAQGGGCAVCGGPPRSEGWHVDHDHETKKVRGILCGKCNTGLGLFKDNPTIVARALAYLRGPHADAS